MKEPEELARLRSAIGRPERCLPLSPRLGTWARALAAAKPGTALLHLCESSDEMAVWVHSGMDLGSRLVVVSPEPEGTKALDAVLGSDLRVTCHCQHPDAFLEDIRSHRFGLIVHDSAPKDAGRVDRLWEVLSPGGLLLICGLNPASTTSGGHPALGRFDEFGDAAVAWHAGVEGTLLAARLILAPSPTRRGGRRARREPGSVTALRPRT